MYFRRHRSRAHLPLLLQLLGLLCDHDHRRPLSWARGGLGYHRWKQHCVVLYPCYNRRQHDLFSNGSRHRQIETPACGSCEPTVPPCDAIYSTDGWCTRSEGGKKCGSWYNYKAKSCRNGFFSAYAINGLFSLLAVNTAFSLLTVNGFFSVMSCNCVFSLLSLNSVCSVFSSGSFFAVGCHGESFKICY